MLQRREGDGRCFFFSSSLIIRPPLSPPLKRKPKLAPRHPASIASLALAQALLSSPSPDVAGAAKAARDLSAALEGEKATKSDGEDAGTPIDDCGADGDNASSKALKIANAAGAVSSVSKALTLFERSPELRRGNKRDLEALLRCLARLCASDAGRDAAGAAGVPAKLCDLLAAANSSSGGGENDSESDRNGDEPDLVAALAAGAAAAATAHEGNKCALVDCGFGAAAAAALLRGGGERSSSSSSSPSRSSSVVSPAAIRSLSAALCSLATADDPRPAASRAFQNGRTLGSEGVPAACLVAFRRAIAEAEREVEGEREGSPSESWMDTAAAAAMAARRSVVNDELCREFADAGGAAAVLRALLPPAGAGEASGSSSPARPLHHARLARSCCSLLRQLAGSDALKAPIVDGGGLNLVARAVAAHPGRHSVAEQALGLLVALTLRNPDACAAAVESGCVRAAADVLRSGAGVLSGSSSSSKEEQTDDDDDDDDGENAAPASSSSDDKSDPSSSSAAATAAPAPFTRNPHQWAQRQACAAIRNVVSRSLELRPAVLSPGQGGVEPLLRAARDRYPEACGDVGAAALRDLGCDDYAGTKGKKTDDGGKGTGKGESSIERALAAAARAEADGRFGVAV